MKLFIHDPWHPRRSREVIRIEDTQTDNSYRDMKNILEFIDKPIDSHRFTSYGITHDFDGLNFDEHGERVE